MTCVGWAAFFCPDHHSVCGLFGYYDEAVRTGIILCRSRLVQYLSIMVTTELAVSGVVVVLMVSAFAVGLTSLAAVRAGARKLRASPRLAFTLYAIMSKSISVKRKKPGRPATGTEPLYGVRISDDLMGRIEKWAAENTASRSEAIRRLVELGLKAKAMKER